MILNEVGVELFYKGSDIFKRIENIIGSGAFRLGIEMWNFPPAKMQYSLWISVSDSFYCFKAPEEINDWCFRKELLRQKF